MASEADARSFGTLLRNARQLAGLTQEVLAERAGVSIRGIQALERGHSQPQRETARRLALALGLRDRDRAEFLGAATPAPRQLVAGPVSEPISLGADSTRHNLPVSLSSFVGRAWEREQVCALVAANRLVTLVGAGGVGKTRLALEAARTLLASFPEGIWLADLAPLADPDLVSQAVATALGVVAEPGSPLLVTLTAFLHPRRLLLVLDNCEHLVLACAEVVMALLQACPQVQILATSREALGITGERAWRVPSLSLPDPQQPVTAAQLPNVEAVQLFVERAQSVDAVFTLSEQNAAIAVQVCRMLDGIPLALELAAARLSVLTLEGLAARLDDCFRLLTGGSRTALPRQQTLRATLDWSWDLLTGAERILLRRLSVFAGSWTLEAAESVCSGHGIEAWSVLDLLGVLMHKSLVSREDVPSSPGRFTLLETVRQYAQEHLEASGEAASVRVRHLDWCLALAEPARPMLRALYSEKLPQLQRELDNLRVALRWALESGEASRGLRLAHSLGVLWDNNRNRIEGLRWLQSLLALGHVSGDADSAAWAVARAQALEVASMLAFLQTEVGVARELAEQSLALCRDLEDSSGIAAALRALGGVARDEGDFGQSAALLEESLVLERALGNSYTLADTLLNLAITLLQRGAVERAASLAHDLFHNAAHYVAHVPLLQGMVAWEQGDLAGARALGRESLALFRQVGERRGIAVALSFIVGPVLREQGHLEGAQALFEESLVLGQVLGDGGVVGWASLGLGLTACEQGELARAQAALVEGLSLFWVRGMRWFMARCLAGLASVACAQGRARRAARLAGATDALLAAVAAPLPRGERAGYSRATASARETLGDAFAAVRESGLALSPKDAVAFALDTQADA